MRVLDLPPRLVLAGELARSVHATLPER